MDKHIDLPVFFDQRGRRWKIICSVLLIGLVVLGVSLFRIIPQLLRPQHVNAFQDTSVAATAPNVSDPNASLSPSEASAIISRSNTPVIGVGPLVRVVHIQRADNGAYAVPMYSDNAAQPLTDAEQIAVGGHDFAVERYGNVAGTKKIVLTFDDGPNPIYTPQILDLLSKKGVTANFFLIGSSVVKYPQLAQREVREGHVIGNHTFDHVNFDFIDSVRGKQEIAQTNRVIQANTGYKTSLIRLPYVGNDDQSLRDNVLGILTSQSQNFTIVSSTFDSGDWKFSQGFKPELPKFDGTNIVVLMHDSGGNRGGTIPYLLNLINSAKANGYSFINLNQLYHQTPQLFAPVAATTADKTSNTLASLYLVWPHKIIGKLFILTVGTLILSMLINGLLALLNMRRKYGRRRSGYNPLVSVLVPSYNEEKVLAKTVQSILRSSYRNIEVIIVNDGSKDLTSEVAKDLARRYKKVQAFDKSNGGKSTALNFAIKRAHGEIIVAIDADTVFPEFTLGKLVRHFYDPKVGAVAGTVKVGNIGNMVTRWQALDYIVGIFIERNAQAYLNAVAIVPGACGAWRRDVILAAGGFSHMTLAEDFDLALNVHRLGYKVLQDNEAISFTEAPSDLRTLSKQRFRWIYGNVQVFWKNRDMLFRLQYGWLGMFVLPNAIFNVLLPIFFVPLLIIIDFENILAGNYGVLVFFFVATMAIQMTTAMIGVILAREAPSHLLAVPMTRLVYNPIRSLLLYRTVLNILRGSSVGWNKFNRTGTVQLRYRKAVRKLAPTPKPISVVENKEA